jgi:thioredoxin reductase (NADPH)
VRTPQQLEEIVPISDRGARGKPLSGDDSQPNIGTTREVPVRQPFLFIGAEPNTAWLNECVDLDAKEYVLTGAQSARDVATSGRYALQTSMPRVFAIGDVRGGSTKRVASAVGEGAAVVAQIHAFLAA